VSSMSSALRQKLFNRLPQVKQRRCGEEPKVQEGREPH
jgi:hypothetical protein